MKHWCINHLHEWDIFHTSLDIIAGLFIWSVASILWILCIVYVAAGLLTIWKWWKRRGLK